MLSSLDSRATFFSGLRQDKISTFRFPSFLPLAGWTFALETLVPMFPVGRPRQAGGGCRPGRLAMYPSPDVRQFSSESVHLAFTKYRVQSTEYVQLKKVVSLPSPSTPQGCSHPILLGQWHSGSFLYLFYAHSGREKKPLCPTPPYVLDANLRCHDDNPTRGTSYPMARVIYALAKPQNPVQH